jgi:hypothetical protein
MAALEIRDSSGCRGCGGGGRCRRDRGSTVDAAPIAGDDGGRRQRARVPHVPGMAVERRIRVLGARRNQAQPQRRASRNVGAVGDGVLCRVNQCLESDENCAVGVFYEPGCCFGTDCSGGTAAANQSQCGEYCPPPPDSCYLIDPTNATCLRPECYACHQVNGQDTYVIKNSAYAIDCLEAGTAVRPENGQMYKWAIFCGPVITGPVVEENRDLGEYQCGAFRVGANYSDDDGGGLQTGVPPCQFIALAECGCGPSGMHTFGLPDPTGPCRAEGDCPYLCEDAGPQYARNLCRSFPGNITWWEGQNASNSSEFYENGMAPDYTLEIYIKGHDDQV